MATVIYDGFSFADNGLILTNIDHMTLASRDNQTEKLANTDGAVLLQSRLGTKPVYLEGYYTGADITSAQSMYDTLAAMLNRQQRSLVVPHAGSTRSYTATPQNVVIKQPDGLNRLTFSFEFVVPSGASDDETTLSLVNTTVSTAFATIPLTVYGSVSARPLITITYTTVTGGTGQTLTLRNGNGFVGITLTRNFVTGDTIIIDSENFNLYVNGVLTAPTGRLPKWASGPGSLYYSDTFTTRTATITATYNRKDL